MTGQFTGSPPPPPAPPPYGSGPYAPAYPPPPPPGLGSVPMGYAPVPVAPPSPIRSGMAVAALVTGIVGVVTCLLGVAPVLAVVFGLVGARQVKRSRGTLTGLGMARGGWILGLVGSVLAVLIWSFAAADGAFEEIAGRGMQVGTCIDLDTLDDRSDVAPTVDCAERHDAEVYEIGWLDPQGERGYPGRDAAFAATLEACAGEPFTEYVGVPSDESALRIDGCALVVGLDVVAW